LNQLIYKTLLLLTTLLLFQSCSYVKTITRAQHNEDIKGTQAYYDEKCLVAEECALISAKIIMPLSNTLETLAIAVVVDDGKESRVIDLEVINFSKDGEKKVSYFFFNLPVGEYTIYTLKMPEKNTKKAHFSVLAQRSGLITTNDLTAYHNVAIFDDIEVDPTIKDVPFTYTLEHMKVKLEVPHRKQMGFFENNVTLDDPIFSHQVAMEGLYYPEEFSRKTKGMYRLAPKFVEGTIPIIFVHGMAGTPRDWTYMLKHLDLTHYTPYVVYYPSGEDFTKLSAQFNAWILSDKIFEYGSGVIIAHSFGGIIVRDAANIHKSSRPEDKGMFISLATPFGGDAKASEGVKNAPYVIPSWRSIADDGTFIKNLYRTDLSKQTDFHLIFAYNNSENGPSGDGRVPLTKQLRTEAQNEAQSIHGFNEDHISILKSKEATAYINTLLKAFAKKHLAQEQK